MGLYTFCIGGDTVFIYTLHNIWAIPIYSCCVGFYWSRVINDIDISCMGDINIFYYIYIIGIISSYKKKDSITMVNTTDTMGLVFTSYISLIGDIMGDLERYQKVFLSRDPELSSIRMYRYQYPLNIMSQYNYIEDSFVVRLGDIVFEYRFNFLLNLWAFDKLGGKRDYNNLKKSWAEFKDSLEDAKNG